MVKRIVLMGVFLVVLLLSGCVRHQTVLPVGENTFMVETTMDGILGMKDSARFKVMDEMAKKQCTDYTLISKSQRYDRWSGVWVLQWVIKCPADLTN